MHVSGEWHTNGGLACQGVEGLTGPCLVHVQRAWHTEGGRHHIKADVESETACVLPCK